MQNQPKTNQEPQTLTSLCGFDESEFEKYLNRKDSFLECLDQKARARVSDALEKRLSWVA